MEPELTGKQHQELGQYLSWFRDEPHRDPLKIALLISGDRSAALINPDPWISLRSPLTFCDGSVELFNLFGLESRKIRDMPAWIAARNSLRLDLLPTRVNSCASYHRRLGTILGYPADAIDYFSNFDEITVPEQYAEDSSLDVEEVAYTQFVFYIPRPTSEGYQQAISLGKERYSRLCMLADLWQLPDIKSLADEIREEFIRTIESNEQRIAREKRNRLLKKEG
ncbi:hypothetical protein [Halocatena halophila]|uniref:hypothetical protein n=1 Tax=Halocatena halophila TaxID=2814576 RepID=UPI002ED06EBB